METLSSYSVLTQCPRLECCAGFSRQTTGPDVFGSPLLRISHVVQVSPGQLWCRFQWRKTLATGRGLIDYADQRQAGTCGAAAIPPNVKVKKGFSPETGEAVRRGGPGELHLRYGVKVK